MNIQESIRRILREEVTEDKNLYGEKLRVCSTKPMTGFYRDGYCKTGDDDTGSHTVCARVTEEFLEFTKSMGNNLDMLEPGDKWCLCAKRWEEANKEGVAPEMIKSSTNIKTLDIINSDEQELDEYARTLKNARRQGVGLRFPKSAVKANPQRFRKYTKDNINESEDKNIEKNLRLITKLLETIDIDGLCKIWVEYNPEDGDYEIRSTTTNRYYDLADMTEELDYIDDTIRSWKLKPYIFTPNYVENCEDEIEFMNESDESRQERKFTKLLNNIEEYINSNSYNSVVRVMVDYDEVMDDVIVNIFFDAEHAVKLGGGINSVIKKSGKKIMEDLSVFPFDFKYHIHFEKPQLNESLIKENKDQKKLIKGIIDSSDIFDYKHFCGFDIITPEERSDQYNFLNKNKIPYLIKVYFVGGPNSEVWPRTQAIRNKELDLMEELHEYIKSFVPFNIEMMGSHVNSCDGYKKLMKRKYTTDDLQESIRKVLREEDYSPAGKEIIPNSIIVHKSNPMFRDKIMEEGLKVRAGECYKIFVGYGVKCKPAIFATNSTNKKAWFDSTYDDDIWFIDTRMIPDVKWYKDRHYESRSKHIVTFQDIPKEAITLKYEGTGSGDVEKWDKDSPNLYESIKKILKEETNKNDIKSILFNILNQSEYVQKFDYVWSPNLSVGSPIMFINDLSESDFFDKKTNIFDLIGEYWPYGKKDYEDWKDLYYGLVYGYVIKDKNSDTKILVQVIRFDDDFKIYLNPNYKKEIEGDKIFIDNEMINVFTSGENTYSNNDFTFLGIELEDKVKTINDMKNIFNYLDALI
jgi:hypothetical protein